MRPRLCDAPTSSGRSETPCASSSGDRPSRSRIVGASRVERDEDDVADLLLLTRVRRESGFRGRSRCNGARLLGGGRRLLVTLAGEKQTRDRNNEEPPGLLAESRGGSSATRPGSRDTEGNAGRNRNPPGPGDEHASLVSRNQRVKEQHRANQTSRNQPGHGAAIAPTMPGEQGQGKHTEQTSVQKRHRGKRQADQPKAGRSFGRGPLEDAGVVAGNGQCRDQQCDTAGDGGSAQAPQKPSLVLRLAEHID